MPGGYPNIESLEEALSCPTDAVCEMFSRGRGDVAVLGAAGKMGPTLARMARRAMDQAGRKDKVFGVSRFSDPEAKSALEAAGVETIAGDLLDDQFVAKLPDATDVVYMAGMKFGSTGQESLTWAMNTLLPAAVCQRYRGSRIAAFSTGNVYGMVPLHSGGSIETDTPNPQGEYAMSCLGRERVFEHFSLVNDTRVSILRLNYACEMRYGVLVDLASKIQQGQAIDVTMPAANVIWQRDANAMALLSLEHADSPAFVLNLAGPEQFSIRRVTQRLGELLQQPVALIGQESGEALLSNGQLGHRLMGYPTRTLGRMIEDVAAWQLQGGKLLGKATKYEVRDGKF